MLLYRAALRGVFGSRREYGRGAVADALFVYLDGEPCSEAFDVLETEYAARPLVCLTPAWEKAIRARHPDARVFWRARMAPMRRFAFPERGPLPAGYEVRRMDAAAFARHPFGHGANYHSYAAFRAEGAGAVAWKDGEIVASASSFLSMDGEVELDVSTREDHRCRGLATACVARMLRDCVDRGITVHWDAQNETSRRMAQRFGFSVESVYPVYWLSEL